MSDVNVTGNGIGVSENSYHTTINGKRSPDNGNNLPYHQAMKRPKTDINGCDPAAVADIQTSNLCNGQPMEVSHDKLSHLSIEQTDRLTKSPSPRLTQSAQPVNNSLQSNELGEGGNKAVPAVEDHRSNVESEPEIITLSDSEDELREVLSHAMRFSISDPKTVKMLRRHQQKLRLEESKLLLLKKLRESMSYQHRPSTAELSVKQDVRSPAGQLMSNQKAGANIPPPLKRGLHLSPGHHSISSNKVPNHHVVNQQNLPSAHTSKQLPSHGPHGSSHGSAGPPPLVNMAKNPASHSNGSALSYSQSTPTTKKPAPPQPPQLTAEQKLNAAKIALKKQLEQSLQQIPTPKPPPPEVNFLPSLASGEFVYLLGMEEVVKHILSRESKDSKYVVNPFTCVQCDTDFTPVWKRDKPGSKNVICEKCISTKQKKSMRKEHTAKLKATFAKALQKEREIERRINAGSPLNDIPGLSTYAATNSISQQQRIQSNPSPAPSTPNMPQLTPQHLSSHHNSASSAASSQLATAHLQQQQALIQAQAAEQMRAMLTAQAMALPYQLYGVSNNKQVAELQRQYLLDMINPNRSWKT